MNVSELSIKVFDEMKNTAFDKRKDVYSQFEFDYLHLMKDYIIDRKAQCTYTFESKITGEIYFIDLKTSKNGNHIQLVQIINGKW